MRSLTFGGLTALLLFAGPAPAQTCETVTAAGTLTQNTPDAPFEGTATIMVPATGEEITATVRTDVLGILGRDEEDGAVSGRSSTQVTAEGGVDLEYITFDDFTLVPAEAFASAPEGFTHGIVSRDEVVRGTGRYNCGELVHGLDAQGQPSSWLTVATPNRAGQFEFSSVGTLCDCEGRRGREE